MSTAALLIPIAGIAGFWAGIVAEQHRQRSLAERACLDD